MTQDFANKKISAQSSRSRMQKRPKNRKNIRRSSKTQKAPAWAWLLIGLLLATLITLLIYLANKEHEENRNDKRANKANVSNDKKIPQPRFDFYNILKEQEIKVEDRSAEIEAATPKNILYYLQAGSFKNASDAEALKVELLLINLPSNIEINTNNTGTSWHRVIVGPFKNRSTMAKARSALASKQLRPLLIKRTID